MKYMPLEVAARKLDMTPDDLRTLCPRWQMNVTRF